MDIHEISEYIESGVEARKALDPSLVLETGNEIARCFGKGGKLIIFGNGGSAADAQHIAAEFVGRFEKERRSLPALALNTNTSSITAIGNDYSFDAIFSRQIEAFAAKGDVVVGISTSGNSANVNSALEKANSIGCVTIALTGRTGGSIAGIAKKSIIVRSNRTSIIQEVHIAIGHMWSKIVEDTI
ncbi:MAG: phosphoheptose isomerase [Thermoplasmatales archaeon B_DKE]|nr:MAG: phosphoheptose isomerase [Thermoplasmatales archaeon B_DKE]